MFSLDPDKGLSRPFVQFFPSQLPRLQGLLPKVLFIFVFFWSVGVASAGFAIRFTRADDGGETDERCVGGAKM